MPHSSILRAFAFRAASSWGVVLCAVSCAPELTQPTAADVARLRGSFEGPSSLAELREGRELYQARCGTCHALRSPLSLRPRSWIEEVHDMRENKGVHLSPDEARRITAYLVAVSSR